MDKSGIFERNCVKKYAAWKNCPETMTKDVYENDAYRIEWTGDKGKGDGATHDMIVFDKKNNKKYTFEIKDDKNGALSGAMDLHYTENGKLYPAPKSKKDFSLFAPYVNEFNLNHNYLELKGNYKLEEKYHLPIVKKYYSTVDFFLTIVNNKLICIPANIVHNYFDYSGSEIRRRGRNGVKIFTPKHLEKTILNHASFISEDKEYYTVKNDIFGIRNPRNTNVSRKFNLPSVYEVEKDKVVFLEDGVCKIPKKHIKQKNGHISIHTKLAIGYNDLKKAGFVLDD